MSELREVRNRWAHMDAFSADDAYRALDSIQRLLTAVSSEEAIEVEREKKEVLRLRYDEYSRRKSKQVTATLFETATPVSVFSQKLGAGQREEFEAWLRAHLQNGFYVNCKGRSLTLHRAGSPAS